MSFVLNDHQQMSLFDSLTFLSERKQNNQDQYWLTLRLRLKARYQSVLQEMSQRAVLI